MVALSVSTSAMNLPPFHFLADALLPGDEPPFSHSIGKLGHGDFGHWDLQIEIEIEIEDRRTEYLLSTLSLSPSSF